MKKIIISVSTAFAIIALQFSVAAMACDDCPAHAKAKGEGKEMSCPHAKDGKGHKDCKHKGKGAHGECKGDPKNCPHHKADEAKPEEKKAE